MLVGIAFAFGWTPCIGPILGGILTIAGSREPVSEGMRCSPSTRPASAFPFILTALAVDKFFVASARIRKHYRMIEFVAGGLLILLGVLIFTGQFTQITRYIDPMFPWLTNLS